MPDKTSETLKTGKSKWIYVRWALLRLALVVYDIIAVNASVVLALLTRFYVAKEFHEAAATTFAAYRHYAVFYTLFCVLVFGAFKLYNSMWKYAGFHDLNRLIKASAVAFAGHVCGTLLFGIRMPISIYLLSGVFLFCMLVASRFSYSIMQVELGVLKSHKASVNALLVGTGGTARSVMKQLEQESVVRPACMLAYKGDSYGALFDGVPTVNGVDSLKAAVEKYHINLVVLASTMIPQETRNQIKEICGELNVEVQDYSGFFQNIGGGITLKQLAECSDGAVELVVNGQHQHFDDCEQAMMNTAGKYVVKSISAKNGSLVVTLADNDVVLNDLNEDWVKEHQQETGEDVSFF